LCQTRVYLKIQLWMRTLAIFVRVGIIVLLVWLMSGTKVSLFTCGRVVRVHVRQEPFQTFLEQSTAPYALLVSIASILMKPTPILQFVLKGTSAQQVQQVQVPTSAHRANTVHAQV